MTSLKQAILPAPLNYRGLQELRNEGLSLHHSYDSQIYLTPKARTDLIWWIEQAGQWKSRPIRTNKPVMTLESDASNLGWGAVRSVPQDSTGGVWNRQERSMHINSKELLAAWLGLRCYASNMRNAHIHLRIDNTIAVAHINKMGGTHSWHLCQLTIKVWNWCLDRRITISAEHLPGSLNQLADTESRAQADSSEWALDLTIFQQLMAKRGPCTVDLFASRLSAKLPTYYSWRSDPGATAVDALCQPWNMVKGYAFPPFLSNREMPGQDKIREGSSDGSDNPTVEIASMVPTITRNVGGETHPTPVRQEAFDRSNGCQPPHGYSGPFTASRLDCVRSSLQSRGLSEEAIALICASWRVNTEASYSSGWRIWSGWCSTKGVNPSNTSIEIVIEFLTAQFHQGKQYSTLNSYRSCISGTHMPVDGFQVGKHPLVSRAMKGAFHLRPPQPRYSGRWDVSKVLQHLKSKGNIAALSLKDLTFRLVMLLALANADRASDLWALDVKFLSMTSEGASFRLASLTKTARPDKPITSCYSPLPDASLCPVRTLQQYLTRTVNWRESAGKSNLFLSLNKPHHPVTSATIARWLKQVLREAGVAENFSAHSTRATAVSVAFDKGVPISDIMKTADWSSDSVFKKYYYKPMISVNPCRFANAVLTND